MGLASAVLAGYAALVDGDLELARALPLHADLSGAHAGHACLEAARGLATEHGYVAVQEVVAQRLGGQPDPARLRRR